MNTISAITTERLRALIAEEVDHLTAVRHDLHAHPELGYAEHRTSGVVQRELDAAGVSYVPGVARGTGVIGHLPGEDNHATGLRADMDALPIVEETGLDYASTTPGCMHACGHDGHTTILLGAARVLSRIAAETPLPRPVTFCFQPAEEGGAGGRAMVEDGCLDGSKIGPAVSHMFGLHGWPQFELGTVSTRPGPMLAAADMFEVEIRGTGAHAAYPHVSHDPIVCAATMISAAQQLVSRGVDPLDSAVVSITKINGGTAHNIIPQSVSLLGTVRTLQEETKRTIVARLHDIVEHTARAHGCTGSLKYHDGYPVTKNDSGAVDIFNRIAVEALGESRVPLLEQPVMGGEDFSFYCHQVPSCFFALGLRPETADEMPDLHQPTFDFNDDAIPVGVEMFCRLALRN
ncbi:MAG: amidohydrolase [Planctomycetota bacterium]